jgi:hypothetical protein
VSREQREREREDSDGGVAQRRRLLCGEHWTKAGGRGFMRVGPSAVGAFRLRVPGMIAYGRSDDQEG